MKIGIEDTFYGLCNDPEYNKILGVAGEQGRIIGILEYYKEKCPELTGIFDHIMKEIETGKNND